MTTIMSDDAKSCKQLCVMRTCITFHFSSSGLVVSMDNESYLYHFVKHGTSAFSGQHDNAVCVYDNSNHRKR